MIRYRLRRYAEAAIALSATAFLCVAAYANQKVFSVDTNQPTSCMPDTETPYAGVSYQVNLMLSDSLQTSLTSQQLETYVVSTYEGEDTTNNEDITNNEQQLDEQSTTTDENSTTDNDENIEEAEPVEDTQREATSDEDSTQQTSYEGASSTSYGELNTVTGRITGPSGSETYYNLNMSHCVERMQSLGYDYEYWVREDGVKMFGPYVMVAADFNTRPLGTVLDSSLGQAIVVDTGDFAESDPTCLDIATNWE